MIKTVKAKEALNERILLEHEVKDLIKAADTEGEQYEKMPICKASFSFYQSQTQRVFDGWFCQSIRPYLLVINFWCNLFGSKS